MRTKQSRRAALFGLSSVSTFAAAAMLGMLCPYAAWSSTEKHQLAAHDTTTRHTGACYRSTDGNRYEICRLYERNLNRFCGGPVMVCERKIHGAFAREFSAPKWETLAPEAHLEIVAEVIRSRITVASDCVNGCAVAWREKQWREYRPDLMRKLRQQQVTLARVRLDLNHDGERELVYRLTEGTCEPEPGRRASDAGFTTLMVYDEVRRTFRPDYAKYLRRWSYDILLWRGRAYLTLWDDTYRSPSVVLFDTFRNENPAPEIHVEFGVKHLPLCEFRYEPK
ncbi:MAG TPA: hypothetical protein VED01_05375 [Burkholderiales bacterium]|nr:hypothetical protein [Burkholderiales bacterium]